MSRPSSEVVARSQKKAGLMSKSYKLKKEVVEAFARACATNNESQASVLTKFMTRYIEESTR